MNVVTEETRGRSMKYQFDNWSLGDIKEYPDLESPNSVRGSFNRWKRLPKNAGHKNWMAKFYKKDGVVKGIRYE
jgi:hypothetical protein